VAGGEPLPITHDDADHDHPRWTPNADAIVYFKPSADGGDSGTLYEVGALGRSTPRRITDATTGADVSHDGRIAAFQKRAEEVVLSILDRDGGATKDVIKLPAAVEYETPRWSPSNRWVAFVANKGNSEEVLYVVASSGGEPRQVKQAIDTDIKGLAWLPEDAGLVYASASGSTMRYPPVFNLRKVSLDGATDQQLTVGDVSHVHPDVAASGQVYASRVRMESEIWRFPATGPPANFLTGLQITRQTAQVQTPSASPSGEEVVYLSDSGGHANVWIARVDGKVRPRQLTTESDPDLWVGLPLWSPVGDRIVYITSRPRSAIESGSASSTATRSAHWIIKPDGTRSNHPLVEGGTGAAWSPDGKWLYYQIYSPAGGCIYKIAVDGGKPEDVRCGAAMAMPSGDGLTLFFSPRTMGLSNHVIQKANPPHAEAVEVYRYAASRIPMYPQGHALSADGRFIAVPLKDGATTNIWAIPTAGGAEHRLTDFGQQATMIGRQVSWSRDGKFVYAAVGKTDADIVLFDGLVPRPERILPQR
jgi:Tol biopolymer transport system component